MKIRVALVAAFAMIVLLLPANPASAVTRKFFVTTSYDFTDFCRPADPVDQVKWSFIYKAKIRRKNSPPAKKIRVNFKVTDTTLNVEVLNETVYLRPEDKFKATGALTAYTAGHNLRYDMKSSTKSPLTGKMLRATSSYSDVVPTVEQLNQLLLPACTA